MEMSRDPETQVYREKPFRIACFPDLLLSCHSQPTPAVASTLTMIRQAREKRHGPVTINALLMRELTGSYTALADTVQSEVETLGGLVLQLPSREETDLLWRVTQVRSQLLLLSEAVYHKERVIKILAINTEWHSRTHRKAMQSARNSLLRFRDQVTLSQELLANITATYLGRVSLAEAETGARTGVITRHLNSMYVMMLPLLVVQGCFSMVRGYLCWLGGAPSLLSTIAERNGARSKRG
jgi:Mg2+ and Co2+ transporter CorA